MRYPRTDTRVFAVLEQFARFGAMDLDEVINVMKGHLWDAPRSRLHRLLYDAVNLNYLNLKNGKFHITHEVENFVLDVMEMRNKIPKREVVASPYRNIWTKEISGYEKSLYANKRGY